MTRLLPDTSPAGVALQPYPDRIRHRRRQPVGLSSFALDIGFGLGIEIPGERMISVHQDEPRARRQGRRGGFKFEVNPEERGDFSSWRGQVGIQVLGIDPTGRTAIDDIIRQPGFCFDYYGERTRLSAEQLRALCTARSSTDLLMLLANDTHALGLGSLLAPIPRPAEPGFDTGADLRLLIGLDRRQSAPPPVAGLDLAIGIGVDWYDHSPVLPRLERLSPHAHVVRMLTATLHQPGLYCFDYADLRDCVRTWEGYATYRHFAGSLNRFDELLDALAHPDLIPVWQRSRSLLLLISSGVGIMLDHYSAISDALMARIPETCCSHVATALYADRPETEDCNWVWVDVISG